MTTLLRSMSLRARLNIMMTSMILGLVALGAYSVFELRHHITAEKRLSMHAVVDTALGVIDHHYKLQQAGKLDQEEAQRQAKDVIRGLRFAGSEYFWINDLTPRMVMHPIKPELDGQDLSGFKDPTGKPLFLAMVDVVKRQGGGDVDYLWPKPGHDEPVPKISYVMEFKPWGWIVGSGIYIDDVDAAFWNSAIKTIVFVVLGGRSAGFPGLGDQSQREAADRGRAGHGGRAGGKLR